MPRPSKKGVGDYEKCFSCCCNLDPKLTTQSLGSRLTVKRKFKESTSGRDRWWFLLKGEEAVLEG